MFYNCNGLQIPNSDYFYIAKKEFSKCEWERAISKSFRITQDDFHV